MPVRTFLDDANFLFNLLPLSISDNLARSASRRFGNPIPIGQRTDRNMSGKRKAKHISLRGRFKKKKMFSAVKAIKKIVQDTKIKKHFELNSGEVNLADGVAQNIDFTKQIAIGLTPDDREGKKIFLTGYHFKWWIKRASATAADAGDFNIIRMLLYQPYDDSDVTPLSVGVFGSIDMTKYHVFYDKVLDINSRFYDNAGAPATQPWRKSFVLSRKYSGGGKLIKYYGMASVDCKDRLMFSILVSKNGTYATPYKWHYRQNIYFKN